MPLKKSDLYSTIWQSCDALRGGMDASQYKNYVLTILFVKYISDKYADAGPYADIKVPKGASFTDMVKLEGHGQHRRRHQQEDPRAHRRREQVEQGRPCRLR